MIREAFGLIYPGDEIPGLRELIDERTVAALPIAGKYRVIDFPLSNLHNSGIRSVAVVVSRKYSSLMHHLGSGKAWDMSGKNEGLYIVPPYSLRGSLGVFRGGVESIRSAFDYVRNARQDYCVIEGVACIYNLDYSDMMRFHIDNDADITVLYHRVEQDHQVDEQYHEVFFEMSEDGCIHGVEVNPLHNTLSARSLKSYIIRKDLLIQLVEESYARGEYEFSEHLLRNNLDRLKIMGFEHKGYVGMLKSSHSYFDINMSLLDPQVWEELFQTENRIITKAKDSVPAKYRQSADVKRALIANGCIIDGTVENSVLFRDVHVGKGASVKNSIVFAGATISEGAELEYVVLDKNVTVRPSSRLIGNEHHPVVVGKGRRV